MNVSCVCVVAEAVVVTVVVTEAAEVVVPVQPRTPPAVQNQSKFKPPPRLHCSQKFLPGKKKSRHRHRRLNSRHQLGTAAAATAVSRGQLVPAAELQAPRICLRFK